MSMQRGLSEVITGRNAIDGAGVRLVRVIGGGDHSKYDPFLLLDAFDSQNPDDYIRGFPMHPHRGIETFTYLIDGEVAHKDSLGHEGLIKGGECQWMTAGRAILHQEMPQPSPRLRGLQLWINLPARHKMTAPKYRDITQDAIPVIREGDVSVRVVSGEYKGVCGAARGEYVDALFVDVSMPPSSQWEFAPGAENTAVAYMLEGEAFFGPEAQPLSARQAGLFTPQGGIAARAGSAGARFVLFSGAPLREPVAWGGPIVMNTEAELRQAFQELEDGTFDRQ